ncbi:MAG TPA: ATP-binding cassette domain-containing protein [Saprospiraceae bacterium]|nr:ATP-binding cassette domain-containing protein [Saprospiraceae bacterium]
MSSTVLKVDELSLQSVNGYIIQHLSFEIKQAEIVALTGKSGSGKTSIALALLGLLPHGIKQTSGRFTFFHNEHTSLEYPADSDKWPALRGRHIGFIQQDVFGAFDPILKMGNQMLMIIRERSTKEGRDHEKELRSILEEVGISDIDRVLNSYPHQLSGGQLQRCLLCLSIIIRPALLIADEPTSAIDKIHQKELIDVLAFIRKKYSIAILCITHEKSVTDQLADRVIQIDDLATQEILLDDCNSRSDDGKILLEVRNLGYSHRFGGLLDKRGAVIRNINFELSAGQCLGIIGESGSGKSTLAQMLVALLIPSVGQVYVESKLIDYENQHDIRYLRSKIQLVMQDGRGSLHPHKTIRELMSEVVEQQIRMHKDLAIDITKTLEEVGLPANVLDRRAGGLSGGECLRINIARALLVAPEILICDESTSALDEDTRDGIVQVLLNLMESRHMGLILISHDDQIIKRMADKIIVFSEGTILEKEH